MTTPRLILQFPKAKPEPVRVTWVEKFPKQVLKIKKEVALETKDNEYRVPRSTIFSNHSLVTMSVRTPDDLKRLTDKSISP
jgi:hypothetical protein